MSGDLFSDGSSFNSGELTAEYGDRTNEGPIGQHWRSSTGVYRVYIRFI
jgi:hypothetical protein